MAQAPTGLQRFSLPPQLITAMDVSGVLEAHKQKFKSVSVEGKVIPVEYDLGLLAAYDQNPVEEAELKYEPLSFCPALPCF